MRRAVLVLCLLIGSCATTETSGDVVTLTRDEWTQVLKDAFRAGYGAGWKNAMKERAEGI